MLINKCRLRAWAFFLIVCVCSASLSARVINVRGTVTDVSGTPLYRVSIFDATTQKFLAATNEDGKYTVKTDSEATLAFSYVGYEEMEVPVKGRISLDVKLTRTAIELQEVVVKAKGGKLKKVIAEKTEIEVRGNYLFIPGRVRVPRSLFSTDCRVVIQPVLHNATRKTHVFMDPKVFDGQEYAMTQERMYDFDLKQDPLTDFVEVKKSNSRTDDYVLYADSVYVDNPNDDFRCDLVVSIEDYLNILYRDTSEVAKGTVNPLRHLEFNFKGAPVTDEKFFPQPEVQLRDSKGDVNLIFKVNKANLDLDEGNNRAELMALRERLQEIENDPDAKLNSFVITGTASPEGRYNKNLQLAEGRMDWAMDFITKELSESTRKSSDIKTSASVEKWDSVVAMLRADSLNKEADAIQSVIDKYPSNRDRQSQGITALPFYRKLIVPKYLPRLRRVSYELSYSQYRPLSDQEVDDLYRTGQYKEIPRFDFWKLYNRASTMEERETICRKAIETYPKFLVAANDLAAMLIDREKSEPELLLPYLSLPEIPNEVRYNQVASWLLNNNNFNRADSLSELLPDSGMYHKARLYAKALCGKYDDVIQEISEASPINEVVMLLAIKADEQAWEKAQGLGSSAKEDYLRAIASNRVLVKNEERYDLYGVPEQNLRSAIKKDPSLRDLASVDGDMIDLLKKVEEEDGNGYE